MLKTSTDYDSACMGELQWVAGKTFAKDSIRKKRVGTFAAGMVLVAGGLGVFAWTWAWWLLAVCAVGLLPLLWSVFYYPFTGWASSRNLGKNRMPCDFFMEKRAILMTQGKVREEYPYTQCARLMEAERSIYVFLESGRVLILDKSNLMGGSVEELRALLQEKTGKPLEWFGRRQPPKEANLKQS